MRELTHEGYHRLLSHACRETDFAYIGSVGNGPARGVFSGFSSRALATEILQHPVPENFCSDQLTQNMESLVHQFQIEQEPNPECLSGGWIGFLGYELGYVRENRLRELCPSLDVPLMSHVNYWTSGWPRTNPPPLDGLWFADFSLGKHRLLSGRASKGSANTSKPVIVIRRICPRNSQAVS